MKFSNYLNNINGELDSKDDIKILDIDGHLHDLDELTTLDHSDIICMLYVDDCSTEDLNVLCDKVSRFVDPLLLIDALDIIYGEFFDFTYLPRTVSEAIDFLEIQYKLLPEVHNLTKLGEYVFSNNLWDDDNNKGKQTYINFKKIGQDFVKAGKARRTRYGYLLRLEDF